jgi:hypothetical protein
MLKKLTAAVFCAILVLPAQAVRIQDSMYKGCKLKDAWKGPDKTKHILAGALIGGSVTYMTERPEYGVLATLVAAAGKEANDRRGYGTCSFQDFAVTMAAGIAASYGTKLVILPLNDGAMISYTTKF